MAGSVQLMLEKSVSCSGGISASVPVSLMPGCYSERLHQVHVSIVFGVAAKELKVLTCALFLHFPLPWFEVSDSCQIVHVPGCIHITILLRYVDVV